LGASPKSTVRAILAGLLALGSALAGVVSGVVITGVVPASAAVAAINSGPALSTPASGPSPQISISDAGLVQASSGDPILTFNVTLSSPASHAVTVNYQTVDDLQPPGVPGSAHGVPNAQNSAGQYVSVPLQILSIPRGATNKTISVTTLPYAPSSSPRHFTVVLSNPIGATLEDAFGTGTILPAATAPGFSVGAGDTSIREPTTGSDAAYLTVGFSGPAPKKFKLTAATISPGSSDFVPTNQSIAVPAGAQSARVPISVLANPANRSSATISVSLATSLGTMSRGAGTLEVRGEGMTTSRAGRLPGPPRVSLVGDSITVSYTDSLKAALEAEGYAVFENGEAGSGLLDGNKCQGQQASSVVASQDPDIAVVEAVGNYNYRPPCDPSVVRDTPAYFYDWWIAANNDTRILTSKGASVFWLSSPSSALSPWSNEIPTLNGYYVAIGTHTPNVYNIDAWTAFGGSTVNLALHISDKLHLNVDGNQLVTSTSTNSIPATVPSAPIAVIATAEAGSALVNWNVPASNGSPITGYTVSTWDWTNAAHGGQTVNSLVSPVNMTGLTNGDIYVFLMTATNGKGTSAFAHSGGVIPTTVPNPPSSVTATPGNGSAQISWTAPFANGSPITSYTVVAADSTNPANGGQTVSGPGSPVNVGGLTNGDSYTFTVTATNGRGTGAASAPSGAIIPATIPDAPTSVSAIPDANTDAGILVVSFSPGFDEGSTVTSYTATIADLSNASDPNNGLTVSGSGSPITVSGLTPGDTYSFTVTATNALGTSSPSIASSGVVAPAAVPIGASAARATPSFQSAVPRASRNHRHRNARTRKVRLHH